MCWNRALAIALYLSLRKVPCVHKELLWRTVAKLMTSPIGEPEQSLWRLIRERKGLRELIPFGCFERARRSSQNSARLSARHNKMHKWRANRRREWKMHPFIASWPNAPHSPSLSFTIQMQALGNAAQNISISSSKYLLFRLRRFEHIIRIYIWQRRPAA